MLNLIVASVGAEFHVSFDCGGWALVPVDHDILSIMQGNYEASFNKYTPTTADPKINFSLEVGQTISNNKAFKTKATSTGGYISWKEVVQIPLPAPC